MAVMQLSQLSSFLRIVSDIGIVLPLTKKGGRD